MALRIVLTHAEGWPASPSGQRSLYEMATALQHAGQKVRVLTSGPATGRTTADGVEVRRLPTRGRRFPFGVQALGHIAGTRADVWHALGVSDAVAAGLLGTVRRRMSTVFTDPTLCDRPSRVGELIARRVDHYVCVSNTAARSFEDCYHRTPVVQSPGIDVRRFSPEAGRNHQPALLFVADASDPTNNLALLLEAVAMLRWRRPDVELWIAGAGAGHADRLVAEAPPAAKEGTTLLGDIDGDALAEVYPKAWVTVLPAERAAFGLSLVESLASGTPIVALDRGGPAEIVEQGVGRVSRPTAADLAAACEEAVELAGSAEVAADCRAAAWTWDWRTAIVPRLLRLYHHQLGSPAG